VAVPTAQDALTCAVRILPFSSSSSAAVMTDSDRAPTVDISAGAASELKDAHYVRITGHGHLRTFVEFALAFLKARVTRFAPCRV
jgi:hypothetical protein